MDADEFVERFEKRQEFLQNKFKEQPQEHKCNCENCSCDEEDPVLRQIAEEMFDEAIPQNVLDTEIQWETPSNILPSDQVSNKVRETIEYVRQNVNREL